MKFGEAVFAALAILAGGAFTIAYCLVYDPHLLLGAFICLALAGATLTS